jgi:Uma2 family endonuclease
MSEPRVVELRYRLKPEIEAWVLPEVPVPESRFHDCTLDRLKALLEAWLSRSGRSAIVARNLAIRWIEESPKVGVDPDICLIEPIPPDPGHLTSLCLWKTGHLAPPLAIEVVSESHPYKDYTQVQDKYAACGVEELLVLDPAMVGPKKLGLPAPIQVWRAEGAEFSRVYQGTGPARSSVLGAWVIAKDERVFISDDKAGTKLWLTVGEANEQQLAGANRELEARSRELEARSRELEARSKQLDTERAARGALEKQLEKLKTVRSKPR